MENVLWKVVGGVGKGQGMPANFTAFAKPETILEAVTVSSMSVNRFHGIAVRKKMNFGSSTTLIFIKRACQPGEGAMSWAVTIEAKQVKLQASKRQPTAQSSLN